MCGTRIKKEYNCELMEGLIRCCLLTLFPLTLSPIVCLIWARDRLRTVRTLLRLRPLVFGVCRVWWGLVRLRLRCRLIRLLTALRIRFGGPVKRLMLGVEVIYLKRRPGCSGTDLIVRFSPLARFHGMLGWLELLFACSLLLSVVDVLWSSFRYF